MAALILKIHFPPGTPFRTKLMKFKEPQDKTIKETIDEIITTNKLGDPNDFLWFIPEKYENESFTGAIWGKPEETLGRFNLEQKAIIHLRKRLQGNRVKHEKRIKIVLFDYVVPLEQWLPLVAKKFNLDNWRDYNLYVSGEKEPLKLDQSLLCQGVVPDAVFSLRKPDDPVDQPMHPIKQRVTISLNQQNQSGKKFMPQGPPSSSHAQPSLPPPEENIPTKTIKLNAAAKSFTKPDAKGWLIKLGGKGKWEKRYCVVEGGHLFYYKTPNDVKPTGVLPLREYFLKEAKEKKKSSGWDLISVKQHTPPAGGAPERTVHPFKAETEKEKKEWMAVLKKLTSPLPTGPGPKPSPPPLVKGKPAKLYGRPLEQAVANPDGSEIPAIVFKCIKYLDTEENVTREGIFRLSGSSNQIDRYVQRLDKGEDVDLGQELDPHAVAGLLKLYFRDLPEPLMTFELYPWFIASMSTQDRAVRLRYLKYLVEKLPPVNKGLLVYLLTFLLKISTFAEVNKMALHNLATVFAPNLLRSHQSNAIGMVTDTPKINAVINTFLQDYEYVFDDKEIDYSLTVDGKAAACCRALYDYEAKAPDELSFKKGNIIKIIHEREDGWWIGEYKCGNFGRVPATYVQKLSDKQAQEFNKRQQFKQQLKRLTDEKEEQEREIRSMGEQRDELMKEIEEVENRRNKLMAEFYLLKECLAPILATNTVTISDEDKRMGAVDMGDEDESVVDNSDSAPSGGKDKKEKKEKKDKKAEKDKKKDKKDKKGKNTTTAAVPSPLSSSASRTPEAGKVLPLADFPKYVDDFLKESEDHRRALDGVGSTKDVFLTSLEMLSGALPVAKKDNKKDNKKGDPLRHSIDNIKAKTKVEAFTRAELAERKDDLLRDMNELQLILKLTIKRAWTPQDLQTLNERGLLNPVSPSSSPQATSSKPLPSPRRNVSASGIPLAGPPSPLMAQLHGAIGGRGAMILRPGLGGKQMPPPASPVGQPQSPSGPSPRGGAQPPRWEKARTTSSESDS